MSRAFLITPLTPERAGNEDPQIFQAVQNAVDFAVKTAGLQLMHSAQMNTAGLIMDRVRHAIAEADIVLAILTGQNPNVYYELGIALESASRPAILILHSVDEAPFDIKGHRLCTYESSEKLNALPGILTQAINETLALTPAVSECQPCLSLPLVDWSRENRLFYGARAVPLCGRDQEMEALNDFINSEALFQWWILVGNGGQGKSRLALELCLSHLGRWRAGFLRDINFDWDNWKPSHPTLLVTDYAAKRTDYLRNVIISLISRKQELRLPVRLLLIERNTHNSEGQERPWFRSLLGYRGDRYVMTQAAYKPEPLQLTTIDGTAVWQIMSKIWNDTGYQVPFREEVLRRFQDIDPESRPLFATLFAYALSSGENAQEWNGGSGLNFSPLLILLS